MSKDLEKKKAQKIQLLGANLILRGEVEETKIVLTEESKDKRRIKELKVFLVGPDVKTLKEGDEVRVDSGYMMVAHQSKQINPFKYNGSDYKKDRKSVVSLRRTRAAHILSETGNLEAVRLLLGHSDIGSTARYLGAIKQPDHLAISRAYEI